MKGMTDSRQQPGPNQSGANALSVWIVEDNAPYRQSLVRVVSCIVDADHLRAFGDAEDLLAALKAGPAPDALLLDLGLPGMSGVRALPHIKTVAPQTRIIALTSFDDHESIAKAIRAGVSGYLLKTTELSKITGAIREVLAGGAPMTPQVASIVLAMFAQQGERPDSPPEYGLSPRERETLNGMVEGLTAKEIAVRMGVSYHTVDTYVRAVYAKLDVQSRGMAVAKAVREQLF
jgi:DNA-binding NarL/FixJ family response regulator